MRLRIYTIEAFAVRKKNLKACLESLSFDWLLHVVINVVLLRHVLAFCRNKEGGLWGY